MSARGAASASEQPAPPTAPAESTAHTDEPTDGSSSHASGAASDHAAGGSADDSADDPAEADAASPDPADGTPRHHRHPHVPDRWRWRSRIRSSPRQLFVYRIVVGLAGTLCILAGAITGPLPGPGGIPLVLLGLAIWSSEFRWAHRLMEWFKLKLHQVRLLSPGHKALFWVCFFAACLLLGFLGLMLFGIPGWFPDVAHAWLSRLPGVESRP